MTKVVSERVCAVRERELAVNLRECGQGGSGRSQRLDRRPEQKRTQVRCLEASRQSLLRAAAQG